MNTLFFDIPNEDDVIILEAIINGKNELLLALDTAATHTTLDSNILYMCGFRLQHSIGQVQVETSNGIITTQKYVIPKLEVMGVVEYDFEVQVYDFIAHGITSNYDGVLGLDFLRKRKFCIDVPKGEISIQTTN